MVAGTEPITWVKPTRAGFRSVATRALLGAVWLAATTIVIGALVRLGESSNTGNGVVLATLEGVSGVVKTRTDQSILWDDARRAQDLYRGDVVSTGPASSAVIDFPGGRRITLGPSSMVRIDQEAVVGGFTGHLKLNLLKGQVASTVVRGKSKVEEPRSVAQVFESVVDKITAATVPEVIAPSAPQRAEAPEPLEIAAGGEKFAIAAGSTQSLALSKDPGQARVQVLPPPPPIERVEPVSVQAPAAVASSAVKVAPKAVPTPTPSLAPKLEPKIAIAQPKLQLAMPAFDLTPPVKVAVLEAPKLKVKATAAEAPTKAELDPSVYVPEIFRKETSVLLTGVSLVTECAKAKDLIFPLSPRPGLAAPEIWRPYLQISPAGGAAFRLLGTSQFSQQFVKLPMEQLCAASGGSKSASGIKFELRGGHLGGAGLAGALSPNPTHVVLASLLDLPNRQATLHFKDFKLGEASRSTWLDFGSPAGDNLGAFALRVKSNAILQRLWRLLNGNGQVVISNRSIAQAKLQLHFGDREGWIATLGAVSVTAADRRLIARELGAEIAYTGAPEGYVRLPAAVKTRLAMIEQFVREDDEVSLVVRGRAVKVTRADIDSDPQSVVALGQTATALLRQGSVLFSH